MNINFLISMVVNTHIYCHPPSGGGPLSSGKDSRINTITFDVDEAIRRLYLRIKADNKGNFNPSIALLMEIFPSIWDEFYPGRSLRSSIFIRFLLHALIHI